MYELIIEIAKLFGLSPLTVAATIPVVILVCNAVTRAIPDTSTGALKYVRIVTKFVGIHVKDNSGLPARQVSADTAIRTDATSELPAAEQPVEQPQPILDSNPNPILKFDLVAEAMSKQQREH